MKQSGAKFKMWLGSGRPPGTLHGMRPAHAAAHYAQQTVAIDKPFRVGGERLMFPTDSSLGAGPEMTINCHCVALPAEAPPTKDDVREFRDYLNNIEAPKHREGRFHQLSRKYGDYLYHQDRERFMVDLLDWIKKGRPKT
jgi:hypothetical protein